MIAAKQRPDYRTWLVFIQLDPCLQCLARLFEIPPPSGQRFGGKQSSGIFGNSLAHAGERVGGGSIPLDLSAGMDARTELLARRARAMAENLRTMSRVFR